MLTEMYLGLGSNLGDRAVNMGRGLDMLGRLGKGLKVSSLYETTPQGFSSQPPFLNAGCRIWTALDPFQVLLKVQEIEKAVGRQRAFPNAPRVLDIDLLVCGRMVLECPGLTIPHPRMSQRAFVMLPLAEIAPELQHPVLKETVASLVRRVSPDSTGRAHMKVSKTFWPTTTWSDPSLRSEPH